MSSRRVVKGASLSKSERDGNVPALTKGAQKPMAATKKSVKQQKTELTPPSEKAPQNSGRGGNSAAATASVKTKAAASVHRLPTQAGEPEGRLPPVAVRSGGPRPSDLSGNSAVRVPGSTPVGVHPINRVASAIGNLVGRRASSKVSKILAKRYSMMENKMEKLLAEVASTKEMLGQMRVPEALAEIRKVVARPAPRIMNYAEAAAKPKTAAAAAKTPGPSTRLGTGHTLIVASKFENHTAEHVITKLRGVVDARRWVAVTG
ncbi:hypothetical protein EVAR_83857_1 [Eumeta japonica]|uniref:Uncharacterized protein n=1 Tax=Eumeta variegata TaxID=151549 RepID=A0A4C1UR85_EUMVA|nr:hypothetical protein EVAR_83857_1 [Eumeta japonica]